MAIETIIGFDSAWAGKKPGGICSITLNQGKLLGFRAPKLVGYTEAAAYFEAAALESEYTLMAIDQPTVVPNLTGMRPVERVAASIVNSVKGGVQPANRSKTSMFGGVAPLWPFLDQISARENPVAARDLPSGRYMMEVFPALSLPSMIPEIWRRRRAAKYDPTNSRTFQRADWVLVAGGIADLAADLGYRPIAAELSALAHREKPVKADQDKLDALICLMIALIWRFEGRKASMILGDHRTGYMVTPVTQQTKAVLVKAAGKNSLPVDDLWLEDAPGQTGSAQSVSAKKPTLQYAKSNPPERGGSNEQKQCPECGRVFRGKRWEGIDAHWKANHENIMPYASAWPIIKSGNKPSEEPNLD